MTQQKQEAFMAAYESCHEPFLRYCSVLAWGRMDTRALYQELFLEKGGQINVFELLGLDPGHASGQAG